MFFYLFYVIFNIFIIRDILCLFANSIDKNKAKCIFLEKLPFLKQRDLRSITYQYKDVIIVLVEYAILPVDNFCFNFVKLFKSIMYVGRVFYNLKHSKISEQYYKLCFNDRVVCDCEIQKLFDKTDSKIIFKKCDKYHVHLNRYQFILSILGTCYMDFLTKSDIVIQLRELNNLPLKKIK